MRLLGIARKILNKPTFRLSNKNFSTVAGNTIHITFVDKEGNRAKVPALIGTNLLDVAQQYKIDLEGPCAGGGSPVEEKRTEDWTEYLYGEGPQCFICHVQIPSSFSHLLPHVPLEHSEGLQTVWDEEYVPTTSRLACQIKLERKHDGLVVLVLDPPPTDCI